MSRKELPRSGLVAIALAGRITNREGATALQLTPRQFQRLKQRFRAGGAPALRHEGRGRPSPPSAAGRAVRHGPGAHARSLRRLQRHPSDREAACDRAAAISRESVRRLRRALGRPALHRRRPPQHRARRPRAAAAGQVPHRRPARLRHPAPSSLHHGGRARGPLRRWHQHPPHLGRVPPSPSGGGRPQRSTSCSVVAISVSSPATTSCASARG
jgi:hypothetical protein